MGVNLAAKGTLLEEIGALFTGTKILLFQFRRYMFEFRRQIFAFWKISKPPLLIGRQGGVGWVPQDLGVLFILGLGRKNCGIPCSPCLFVCLSLFKLFGFRTPDLITGLSLFVNIKPFEIRVFIEN